ncbi:DUF1995 family protein [Candidatus Cyanaurora vandensis]|uniref:DUF1995 family protein n=1 Tax=Candidatus Cyanaurora vandensis TaxID=2714958 RepID=UPI002580B8C5|nr:DUF1995 family protein [Candidatus Cyanaurora vandensis]
MLPLDFTRYAAQARASFALALTDGHQRIAVDVQIFRRTGPALFKPLLLSLPTPWVAIFGTGNAGLGTIEWGEGPWTLLDSGEALDYLGRIAWETMVLMDASSIENAPMREFWRRAGAKPLVMVSCWPEAPGVIGLGRGPEKERTLLRDQLTVAYYLQAYRFQPLVVHRAYPGPWELWLTQDTPQLLHSQDTPFTPTQLQKLSRNQPSVGAKERFQAFWAGPSFFQAWY